jgi:hypothetical protein
MVISTRRGTKRGKQAGETKEQEPLSLPQNDEEKNNHSNGSQFKDFDNRKGVKRRRVNKEKKELSSIPQDKECHGNNIHSHSAELADQRELSEFNHCEVKRRIAAIQAIRDAQIEHVLIQLRLARSLFSKEQLSMPLLQFLKDYCPNTIAVKNAEGIIELEGKPQNNDVAGSYVDEREWRASNGFQGSFGPHTSLAVDDQIAVIPTPMGFRFSSSAVKDSFLRSIAVHISNAAFEENSEIKMMDAESSFQTPQMDLKMQSVIGTTPKTQRQPKRGEMLLSVHGSPLGIYCEDKMDTISESDKEP